MLKTIQGSRHAPCALHPSQATGTYLALYANSTSVFIQQIARH